MVEKRQPLGLDLESRGSILPQPRSTTAPLGMYVCIYIVRTIKRLRGEVMAPEFQL